MICKFCNAEVPDGAAFCQNCGNKMAIEDTAPQMTPLAQQEPEEVVALPEEMVELSVETEEVAAPPVAMEEIVVPPAEPAAEKVCPNCGYPQEEDNVFCAQCGAKQQTESAPVQPVTPVPPVTHAAPAAPSAPAAKKAAKPPKKKKKGKGVCMGCCLVVVLGILAIVASILITGFATNWFGFYGPATKIALAAKKTVEKESFTAEIAATSSGDEIEGTLQLEMIPEDRHLELLFEMENEGTNYKYAIYDGYLIMQMGEYYYYEDISEDLDELFEKWNNGDKKSLEEFLKEEFDDIEDHVDFAQLDKCLVAYYRDLNSNSWLKENAGYSKTKEDGMTMYCFDVDVYPFLENSLETFEPAFKDADEYDDLKDELQEGEEYMDDIEAEGKIGVKSGELSYVWIKAGADNYDVEFEVTFDNIGETDVDDDELEDMLEAAKQFHRDNY